MTEYLQLVLYAAAALLGCGMMLAAPPLYRFTRRKVTPVQRVQCEHTKVDPVRVRPTAAVPAGEVVAHLCLNPECSAQLPADFEPPASMAPHRPVPLTRKLPDGYTISERQVIDHGGSTPRAEYELRDADGRLLYRGAYVPGAHSIDRTAEPGGRPAWLGPAPVSGYNRRGRLDRIGDLRLPAVLIFPVTLLWVVAKGVAAMVRGVRRKWAASGLDGDDVLMFASFTLRWLPVMALTVWGVLDPAGLATFAAGVIRTLGIVAGAFAAGVTGAGA
jgi:hypothetical protein